MAVLPRPKVEVVPTPDGKEHLVVSRPTDITPDRPTPRCKSYEIRGSSEHERLKNLGEDIINDKTTHEWLP